MSARTGQSGEDENHILDLDRRPEQTSSFCRDLEAQLMSQDQTETRLVPLQHAMGWARLREMLRDEKGWIYRGQRSAKWMLN